MAVLTIGRVGLEDVDLDSVTTLSMTNDERGGRSLRLEGYLRSSTRAKTDYLRQSLYSLEPGALIPITWTQDATLNGYYWFEFATIEADSEEAALTGIGYFHFSVGVTRAGSEAEVWFQSRLTGTVRDNNMGVSSTETLPFVGFPAPTVVWWGPSTSVNTIVNRVTSDGSMKVFYDESIYSSTAIQDPRWSVPSSQYYWGAVEVKVDGYIRSGLEIPVGQSTDWTLSNGLVRLSPNTSNAGRFNFESYDGSQWDAAKAITFNYSSGTAITGAWDAITVMRNEPHAASIRLTKSISTATKEPVFLDATLRRGSRFVEFKMSQAANRQMRMGFSTAESITVATSITGSTAGVFSRTVSTSNGNRYVLGSAKRLTVSTGSGYIRNTTNAKTWDSWFGSEP